MEDFADITTPLKQFTEAVHAPENAPGRDEYFKEKAHSLQDHSLRCAHTGRLVGTAGPCKNKRIVEALCNTANQVSGFIYRLLSAKGFILFSSGTGFKYDAANCQRRKNTYALSNEQIS